MKPKIILLIAIILSLLAGGIVTYFIQDSITKVMVNQEAKNYAARIKIDVVDNGLEFFMNPDGGNIRVLYWKTGGKLLSVTDVWVDGEWQLDLGAEDKPTSDMLGDKLDIIVKIYKYTNGDVFAEASCGGTYVKKIYFDNVLKLDTSGGNRFVAWKAN